MFFFFLFKSTQETEDTLQTQFEDNMNLQNEAEVCEQMMSEDIQVKSSSCSEV